MGACWSSSSSSQISNLKTSAPLSSGISPRVVSSNNATSSNGSIFSGNSQSTSVSTLSEECNINNNRNGLILARHNLRIFSFPELKAATRNFRNDTVLGEGGFGKVYKGWLDDKYLSKNGSGSVIAVKKLNPESLQGFQEWQSEVHFLGRLSHPNLVKLIGYCWDGTELLLVYEFMQKGSLENHLFGRGSSVQSLPWDIRLKILTEAAQGLEFLHSSERQVIYRDFKASNILLDGSYTAKISDFGLAKMGPTESRSHVTTRVMGTCGYAAPEYVSTGHLYVKSDVYGFGVVLVEMLTGLRAMDKTRPSGQHNLVEWIKPYLSDRRKLKHIMDSHLEGKYPSRSAVEVAQLALTCIEPEPKMRPSMKAVVETLERIASSNERPKAATKKHMNQTISHRHQKQVLQRRPSPLNSPLNSIYSRNEEHPSYPLPQRV